MALESRMDNKQEGKTLEAFEVRNGDTLHSITSRYIILDFMGEGKFGKVAKCLNLTTTQDVALKIFKNTEKARHRKREIEKLKVLSVLDPVKTNVVQFFEQFEHKGLTCLAFELLDRNLYELMKDRLNEPLSVSEIRPIAHQLVSALHALRGLSIIHGDLKPDNVMLVNHKNQPFRIKLIDFGLSLLTSEVKHGMKMQPKGYRAPEVSLGLPISTAVDMWSLGCVLSFLYLGHHLFGVYCEYQEMKSIVDVLGQPADQLLSAGTHTQKYFQQNQSCECSQWRLKSPEEYSLTSGKMTHERWKTLRSLDELLTVYGGIQDPLKKKDLSEFVNFLKHLLQTDSIQRLNPVEAFTLPFLSMIHLVDGLTQSLHAFRSFELMGGCITSEEDEGDFASHSDEGESNLWDKDTVLAAPCSFEGERIQPAEVKVGPAQEEQPASRDPAEKALATSGSDNDAPDKRGRSRLKRMRKFFSRVTRSVSRLKDKK